MKQLVLIIALLFSFTKAKVMPFNPFVKIYPSIEANCSIGTVKVCSDSYKFCYCKIDFDSNPLKTELNCTNGTSLQWLDYFGEFKPICMEIDDPNKPLGCPIGYNLTNYKTNSSKLVPYCTKIFKNDLNYNLFEERIRMKISKPSSIFSNRRDNCYLLSPETQKRMGFICRIKF